MLAKQGIEVRFAKSNKPEDIASLIDAKTKAVFCESIGNPAGNIIDIEPIAAQAHAKGVPLIVDNTVATTILLNPIDYGDDIVVHALTKYIGGHGNSIGCIKLAYGKRSEENTSQIQSLKPKLNAIITAKKNIKQI